MDDAPWWLHEPPASMPLPWSGEVIPIEEAPPIPPSVPIAGPIIQFVGEGEHAVWNDVFNWMKNDALPAAKTLLQWEATAGQAILNTVESYVGAEVKALSGFINDAFGFASWIGSDVFDLVDALAAGVGDEIRGIDGDLYDVLAAINGIEGDIIPHIEQALLDIPAAAEGFIKQAIAQVQGWAIDAIHDPLAAEIWGTGVKAEVDLHDGLADVLAEAKAFTQAHVATATAAIAAAAAAAAAANAWIDDCGEPMCEVQGPKTDLGKLLKGLQLALDAALFADLASANENDVADAITRIASKASDLIGTFERDFLNGSSTLGGTITDELKQLV